MRWEYTPYIIPLLIATVISVVLALYAWRRRTTTSAATPFALLMLVIAEWSLGYALEVASPDLASKIFWGKVEYIGIVILPLAWLAFALQFSNEARWLTRRNLALLTIVPLITLLLIWTNEAHGLMWRYTALDATGPFLALDVSYGAWFWIHSAFSYLLLLLGTILLVRILINFPYLYQRQAGWLLAGAIAPWLGNGLYISGLAPVANLDLTPFAFTFSGLTFGWNLFHFRLLDVVPVARRAVVESMSDGVIVLDSQNRIVDFNPAAQRIIAHDPATAIGKTITQELATWSEFLVRYRHLTEGQAEVVYGTGEARRYFDIRISPLYDWRKRLRGRLIVLRDITERKQTEEALALARDQALQASRLKTELLAKVSHELRTPLGAILGFAEMLELGVYGSPSEEQKRAMAQIIDSTHYLTGLVNELLDQAQLNEGKLKLNLISFTPADILNDTLSKMQVLANSKGLSLTTDIAADMPTVLTGDLVRLEQILVNLVSNAIKFTQTGKVQVRLCRPDVAHWALQVTDTGIGIPLEAQAYIFEPFAQVDGSMTREQEGFGLGLSIVKQLTHLMGGEVTLESEVGRGSKFTVSLPLQPSQEKVT
jgi:PAS domain S-box-containing protein